MLGVAEKVLMAYPFYRDGSEQLRGELLAKVRPFEPERLRGNHLFQVGDTWKNICLIGDGSIRVYVSGMSGRGILLYNVRPGEICPINMRMVLAGTVALANADPSADLVAVLLDRAAVRDLSARFAEFRHFVQRSVADRFEEIIIRISDITTRRVDHRLLDLLLAEFENSDNARPTIEMTHDEIALAVGAAREVVSRKLHDFERIGALQLGRGRIWLEDRAALLALMKPKQRQL
jgi:CRP/FNR family transcriptional regulator